MKLLKDLSIKEANELFDKNKKFRELCFEEAQENANIMADEFLYPFSKVTGFDYQINPYGYSYIRLSRDYYDEFLDACKEVQKCYGIFSDINALDLKMALKRIHIYDDAYYGYIEMDDERYKQLERFIENTIENLKIELIKCIKKEYESIYDEEYQREMIEIVLDIWSDRYQTDGIKLYETELRSYE